MRRPFLVVFPASVDPASIRVRIRMRDGSTRELRGQANLITPPKGFR
jgi:hypothetical protein